MAVAVMLEGGAGREAALRKAVQADARALLAAASLRQRELSVLLTDDPSIRALNREWRDEDKATDVLSFPQDEHAPEDPRRPKRGPLGDIAISLETAAREAEAVGLTREAMVRFLLVHGFCHLLGHDHAEPDEAARMRADEDRFLAALDPDAQRPPTPY
jgi:probable rRNA maturation factor